MRVVSGIYGGLIAGYTAELAACAGEKKLDNLSETLDSVGDFPFFRMLPWRDIPLRGRRYTQ